MFKVGDRVEVVGDVWVYILNIHGMRGSVNSIDRPGKISVEFDEYVGGHSNLNRGKDGHC